MLQPLLQEYLIEHGNLPLPTTGRLTIQATPASLSGTGKTCIGPFYKIAFSDIIPAEAEVQQLAAVIARKLNISDDASKQLLEKEMGESTDKENDSVNWPEWNLFQNNKDDFNEHQVNLNDYLPALKIEKVQRQLITVAEPVNQPTAVITDEAYTYPEYEEPVAKDYWWVWALIIFVLSVLLIVYRYA